MLFKADYNFGANAKAVFDLLDQNAQVTKTFTLPLPETTNSFSVLNDYFIDANGKKNFLVYAHHFVGAGGPANQKNSIFVVTENGEVKATLDGASAKVVPSSAGAKLVLFEESNEFLKISTYKVADLSLDKTLNLPADLFTFMEGSVVNFMDMKGVPSLVLAHYEKLFMDNDTFEVTPDNHLIIGIYDFDLNLQKNISLDITSSYPDEPYTMPMAEFGMFYDYGKYDITDHTFNSDDDLEVAYAISYFDLIQDRTWHHYYIGAENGSRIHSLEEGIVGKSELQPIAGHSDQLGLYIGEGEEISALKMFDIKTWTPAFEFPAFYNNELLSLNFNRIPVASSYDYLIQLSALSQEAGVKYGKINQYKADGTFKQANKLYLGSNAQFFYTQLFAEAIDPHVYNSDDAIEFSYVTQTMKNGQSSNTFRVAKNETDIIFEVAGDTEKGNVTGSTHLKDANGNVNKLALIFATNSFYNTVDFYDLPFAILGTSNNTITNSLLVYADAASQTIRWNETANSFAIYSMTGSLVKSGAKAQSTSSTGMPKGVYILKITNASGKEISKRFIL